MFHKISLEKTFRDRAVKAKSEKVETFGNHRSKPIPFVQKSNGNELTNAADSLSILGFIAYQFGRISGVDW